MKGFKGYVNYVISICIFIVFLVSNLIVVKFAPQSFLDIVLNSGLMFICWLILRNAMANQGVINGNNEQEVKATKRDHIETSNEISAFKDNFSKWCEKKNKERLKEYRIGILSESTLLYSDYFNENGDFLNKQVPPPKITDNKRENRINNRTYKHDMKMLLKAVTAFVTPYTAHEITSREKTDNRKLPFGCSVKKWKQTKIAGSVIFSLVLSLIFSFIEATDKAITFTSAMIMIFQILLMLASAFVFYSSAKEFICGEWREGLIVKIRIMEDFYRSDIGTITYENDIRKEDGTTIIGKKRFNKRSDYQPLKASKDETDDKETIQTKNERSLAVAKEGSSKQANDCMDNSRGSNLLESSNSMQSASPNSESVVLDSNKCDIDILGGTVYTSSATSDRSSTGAESDLRENQKTQVKEKGDGE